jgi:hypothetical protein
MMLRIRLNIPLHLFLNSSDPNLLYPSLSFFQDNLEIRVSLKGGTPLRLYTGDEQHYRTISNCQVEIRDTDEHLPELLDSKNYQELSNLFIPIVNRTLAAIRNFGWVTTAGEYKPEQKPETLLRTWDARSRVQGQWQAITPKPEKDPLDLFGFSALEENLERGSLSVGQWKDIEQALAEDLKPNPEQEFLTNSLQHLRQDNLRMALIEATVCLEIFLSQALELHLEVKRFFSKNGIAAVLNDVGLTSRVGLLADSIFAHNERSGLQLEKVLKAINWRNKIIHRTGHIPSSVAAEEAKDCIHAMLNFSLRLADKREKLRAEPELGELSRAIANQFDCPAPEVDALKYHGIAASFTFYGPGILRSIMSPSIPEKKIPDRGGLQRIVGELGSRLKKRDQRFEPTKHLSVIFKRGYDTVFASFENGLWRYPTEGSSDP